MNFGPADTKQRSYTMEKETRQNIASEQEESVNELLKKYEEQAEDTSVHGYSETFHNDYSDTGCCC